MADEIAEEVELARDLRAADNRDERTRGRIERLGERIELGLHRPPRIGRQLVREAFGRRMRAMGGRKGVVHIEVAELGEFIHEGRIVLLLALVEARVLKEKHVAVLHRGDCA